MSERRAEPAQAAVLDALGRGKKTNAWPALKNADGILQEIIKVVDSNGDGKIQYEGRHDLDFRETPSVLLLGP